jgi:hypothetical protein
MADSKITALTADTTLHADDVEGIVDTHDPTMASSGTNKRITMSQLFGSLTGDVTYSGLAGTIGAGAVTYAKMQTIAGLSLLGNATGGTAAVEPIALGTNLSFSGTTLNATSGGAGNPGGTSNQIQYNNAGTAFSGFTMSGDATLAVSTGVITVGAGAITTAKIAGAAVTYPKIQNVAASSILGNPTGSPAAPSEITLGAGMSFSGTTLVSSGGGGSGTVNSGTTPQYAYYPSTGTAVSAGTNFGYDVTNTCPIWTPQADPGSPAQGDRWFSTAAGAFVTCRAVGFSTMDDGTFFRCTNCTALASFTSSASLLGSPTASWGSLTVPSGVLKAGQWIEMDFEVLYSSTGAINYTFTWLFGGTTILTTVVGLSGTNSNFAMICGGPIKIICRTVGASGSMNGGGWISLLAPNAAVCKNTSVGDGTDTPSINYNQANALDFKCASTVSSSSNNIQVLGFRAGIRG